MKREHINRRRFVKRVTGGTVLAYGLGSVGYRALAADGDYCYNEYGMGTEYELSISGSYNSDTGEAKVVCKISKSW